MWPSHSRSAQQRENCVPCKRRQTEKGSPDVLQLYNLRLKGTFPGMSRRVVVAAVWCVCLFYLSGDVALLCDAIVTDNTVVSSDTDDIFGDAMVFAIQYLATWLHLITLLWRDTAILRHNNFTIKLSHAIWVFLSVTKSTRWHSMIFKMPFGMLITTH